MMADIFEEEDFYPNMFGFRLSPAIKDESLSDLLELAKEAVRERVKVGSTSIGETPRSYDRRTKSPWGRGGRVYS